MLNRLLAPKALATLVLAALALASSPAYAQDQAATPAPAQDAAAQAPVGASDDVLSSRTFDPVDFDITHDPESILLLDLSSGRRVAIRLMPSWAPAHVERIKTLTRAGFYNGVKFHRVIEGFMAQTGDPTGTGRGGSQLPDLKAEFNSMPHLRGTLSMAHAASDDSANSQFFITFYPRFSLDRHYTNFGRVIGGMDAVDAINRGEPPADPTTVLQASIAADGKPQALAPAPTVQESTITADMLNAPQSN